MKVFSLFALFILIAGCAPVPVSSSGPGVLPSDYLTVTSPAQGSEIAVPFTVSGVYGSGIAQVTISSGAGTKNAGLSAGNWSVVFGTNEVSLGNLIFTINGKDSLGSTVQTLSLSLLITNNGTSAFLVYVTGTLVSNYTAAWKVYGDSLSREFFGTVDTSDGSFSIAVESGIGNLKLIAFRDDNGNNSFDEGEPVSGSQPVVNVVSNNISNISVVIPILKTYTVKGNISGNTYGLRVGAAVFNNDSLAVLYSAPSILQNSSYTISFIGAISNEIKVYYYIDRNGDGIWNTVNPNPLNLDAENCLLVSEFGLINLTNTVDIPLQAKLFKGAVGGNGAGDMNYFRIAFTSAVFHAPIAAGNYSLAYYLLTNSSVVNVNAAKMIVYHDADGDGFWSTGEDNVAYTNNIQIENGFSVSTNTADFFVKKFSVTAGIAGDDSSLFLIQYKDNWNNETLAGPSHTWNSYVFGDGTNSIILSAIRDWNGNAAPDPGIDVIYTYSFVLSNLSVYSTNFNMMRTVAGISTNGDIAPYTNPLLYFGIGTSKLYSPVRNIVMTNYWNTYSESYNLKIYVFEDNNGDGKFGGGDTIISQRVTNNTYIAATNITLIY